MSRLIDADELKLKIVEEGQQSKRYKVGDFWELNRNEIWRVIDDLPTIERKTGKWTVGSDMPPMKHRNGKPKKFWPSLRYCSVCGHEAYDDSDWGETLFDWCPYCGADMRGVE